MKISSYSSINMQNAVLDEESKLYELNKAIKACDFEKVKALVDLGLNLNKGYDYCTQGSELEHEGKPLFQAIFSGDVEILEYLIEHGADVNIKNMFNENLANTTMGYFVTCGMSADHTERKFCEKAIKVLGCLFKYGIDVNNLSLYGDSLVVRAVKFGNFNEPYAMQLLHLLVNYKADINIPCKSTGDTALHYAVTRSLDQKIISYLLMHGADKNIKNFEGRSPNQIVEENRQAYKKRGQAYYITMW